MTFTYFLAVHKYSHFTFLPQVNNYYLDTYFLRKQTFDNGCDDSNDDEDRKNRNKKRQKVFVNRISFSIIDSCVDMLFC